MTTEEKISSQGLVWINIANPKKEDLEGLQSKYGFHELDLEDCLSRTESAKIEEYSKYVFVVFHFPYKDIKNDNIFIESVSVFIGEDYIITLGNGHLKRIDEYFGELKRKSSKRRSIFKKGSGYLLYELIDELFEIYNPYINQLGRYVREIEEEIFEGNIQKDRLYDIMNVKRQIITLKRALLPHSSVILTLENLHKRFINKTLELYFDDIADKIKRDKATLETLDEIIENLQNANESLTSHNTNKVMKVLTIFSVTMLPLTILTGFFGMNINLPLAENEAAFIIIVLLMLGVFALSFAFFKAMRYL